MRLYTWASAMDLICSKGHEHKVREHCIDSTDWRHLLKEFPEYLFKKDLNEEYLRVSQSSSTDTVVDSSISESTTDPLTEE